ncbi:WRC domain [Dillenia turbinata]|uniref:Growth-regulating factor n=1 Tax=Dillenia turbinata TaxID=194707 RepID=A0AAN8WBB1_9MAGN
MNASSRFPFTATQWQELEHQALIYKYIISGVPIPTDLIFTIKRSLDSTISSQLFPHQHVGWKCFQMGIGRKVDPEPGRCRRTDGKKWRCSKEAFPDSKYCERHMHRGRNRSRKPVENMTITATPPTASTISSNTNNTNPSSITLNPTSHSLSSLSSSLIASDLQQQYQHHHASVNNTHLHSPFLNPYLSSSRPPDIGLSTQDTHLLLDSGSYSRTDRDYRYVHGMKDVDEHAFFSEASGTVRSLPSSSMDDDHWQITPLTMSSTSLASSKQSPGSASLQSGYSHLQLKQSKGSHHCHVVGGDFKVPVKDERDDEPHRTVHHFFDDGWPPKSRDSWLGSDDKSLSTTTQLSISIPNTSS